MMYDFTQLKNIGPALAQDLREMGMEDFETIKKIGTEEVFFRYYTKFVGQKITCVCWAYSIEGALTNIRWDKIPEKRKQELRDYHQKIKNSFSSKK